MIPLTTDVSNPFNAAINGNGTAKPPAPQQHNTTQVNGNDLTLPELLDLLGRRPDELTSVSYVPPGGGWLPEVLQPDQIDAHVAKLGTATYYHGVNPVRELPPGKRGAADDVTRLCALHGDIDLYKRRDDDTDGPVPTATGEAIIAELSEALGEQPTAVVYSGGGLHPYWAIADDGGEMDMAAAAALLRRFGRLFKVVANKHGLKADNVFNLDRVLRSPGSYNLKTGVPRLVRGERRGGSPVPFARIADALNAIGLPEEKGDRSLGGAMLHDPDSWKPGGDSHPYVAAMLEGLATDGPPKDSDTDRHDWMLKQAVRFCCAYALGQITDDDIGVAQDRLEKRLEQLRAETGEVVGAYEVLGGWLWAMEKAATKTVAEMWADFGADPKLWPKDYYPCAERVVTEARLVGTPLCYWKSPADIAADRTGKFYRHNGYMWAIYDREMFVSELGLVLKGAKWRQPVKKQGVVVDHMLAPWAPSDPKLTEITKAVRSLTWLREQKGDLAEPNRWTNGSAEDVIPCLNGLVRLSDGELLPPTPHYFNTAVRNITWTPGTKPTELWLNFLREALVDDEQIASMKMLFRYMLTTRTDMQQFIVLIGESGSGKGTIRRVLEALLGEVNCAALDVKKFKGDNKFAMAAMVGKTAAFISDDSLKIDPAFVSAVKQITGEDSVSVEKKYEQEYTARLPTRLWFLTNQMLEMPDNSDATGTRALFFKMGPGHRGKDADTSLVERLLSPEHLPGILAWALEGGPALAALGTGTIPQPERGVDLRDSFQEAGSPVYSFLLECCETGKDVRGRDVLKSDRYWVWRSELYEVFRDWWWPLRKGGKCDMTEASFRNAVEAAMSTFTKANADINFSCGRNDKRGPRGKQENAYIGVRLKASVREQSAQRIAGSWKITAP